MKTDARVRYTQMMIKNSFVTLLKEKPINKITVKNICGLAEINRATFYKYYNDPFDLLDKMENELLEELQRLVEQSEQSSIIETFAAMLEKIKTDGELYTTLFSEHGDSLFPSRIFSLCYKHIAANMGKQFPRLSVIQQEWLYYFMAQGCSSILNRWVGNGMKEPSEEVASFIERLFSALSEEFQKNKLSKMNCKI